MNRLSSYFNKIKTYCQKCHTTPCSCSEDYRLHSKLSGWFEVIDNKADYYQRVCWSPRQSRHSHPPGPLNNETQIEGMSKLRSQRHLAVCRCNYSMLLVYLFYSYILFTLNISCKMCFVLLLQQTAQIYITSRTECFRTVHFIVDGAKKNNKNNT